MLRKAIKVLVKLCVSATAIYTWIRAEVVTNHTHLHASLKVIHNCYKEYQMSLLTLCTLLHYFNVTESF